MKKAIVQISFSLMYLTAYCQDTWNLQLPFSSLTPDFHGLSEENGQYLLHTNWDILQIDTAGTATGELNTYNQLAPVVQTSVIKRYDPASGHPYFIMARRVPVANTTTSYKLAEYRPGTGFVNEITIPDSLGSFSGLRPVILENADGSFVVIGRQFYRKMRYSPDQGFTEEWVRPFGYLASHTILRGDQLVTCEVTGKIALLDEAGGVLWTKNFADAALWRLALVPNGLLVCGQNAVSAKAIIIRLDENGNELWRKETADKIYHSIVETQDGGIAAIGLSANNEIVLARFNPAGNLLWQQEYGAGTGTRLLEDPDGSFIIAARISTNAGSRLIKTDANGQAPKSEPVLIRNRRIRNNNMDVILRPGPSILSDGSNATFIDLPDSAATIFAFAPWIGGFDAGGNLHLSASTYEASSTDFKTGPTNSQASDFNKVWLVTRDQINALRRDYGTDKEVNNQIPYDLLTWPAKGNTHYLYNLDFLPVDTDRDLFPAPFVDVDGDGLYDPHKGDYPAIKGDIMAWSVVNDDTLHTASGGVPLGVEIPITVYALNCQESVAIGKSLFAEYEVVNRSNQDYTATHLGFFTDFDLGCYWDDYAGSLPDADACYVYNSTAQDNDCADVSGFGADIPVQSVSFLNQSMDYAMHVYSIPNPAQGLPATAQIFYYYLTSRWSDSTYLTRGGNGNNPGSTDVTPYAFPDNPQDVQGWSMCTANLPLGDRRMVPSHGPFDLPAGDTFNIKIGFTLHQNIAHPCPDIFNAVQPTLEQIQIWNGAGALDVLPDLGQVLTLQPGQNLALNAALPGAQSYQWSNGENTSGITVSQPGVYAVTVTAATGCKLEDEVLVQLSTSTQDKEPLPNWTIRPNPASDHAWIECGECPSGNGATRIVVRNAQGRIIRESISADTTLRLDTAHWPAGLYWIELWDNSRLAGVRKLSIVR